MLRDAPYGVSARTVLSAFHKPFSVCPEEARSAVSNQQRFNPIELPVHLVVQEAAPAYSGSERRVR